VVVRRQRVKRTGSWSVYPSEQNNKTPTGKPFFTKYTYTWFKGVALGHKDNIPCELKNRTAFWQKKRYRLTCDTDTVLSLSGWSQLVQNVTRHNAPNAHRARVATYCSTADTELLSLWRNTDILLKTGSCERFRLPVLEVVTPPPPKKIGPLFVHSNLWWSIDGGGVGEIDLYTKYCVTERVFVHRLSWAPTEVGGLRTRSKNSCKNHKHVVPLESSGFFELHILETR
jgi:hypothetical protein